MQTNFTEDFHAGAFIASEAEGTRSRDGGLLLAGQAYKAGHVLGKISVGTSAAGTANAGNTGTGTMSAITLTEGVEQGAYKLEYIAAGAFNVIDPNGAVVGEGKNGVAFAAGGLGFTMTASGTAWVAGDGFGIVVAANANVGKYKEYNPANADGSQIACAVLFAPVDATDGDVEGVVFTRDAELISDALIWFADASDDQQNAGLAELANQGLIGR